MGVDDETEYDYEAIDFLSGMLAGATGSKNVNKALDSKPRLGTLLVLRRPAPDRPDTDSTEARNRLTRETYPPPRARRLLKKEIRHSRSEI